MRLQQKAVLTWIGTMLGVTLLGYFLGDISLEQKLPQKQDQKSAVRNTSGIDMISGLFYTSPGGFDQILALYRQPKNTLSLEIYEFTEKRFRSLFKELLEKNVTIKLIMEDRKYQQFKNTFKEVQNYLSGYTNFHIQSDKGMKTTYVHSKFALIDSGFIVQTANLTHSSFFTNREYFFYSTHSGVYQSLATIFDKDWQGVEILESDIHPNLLVCPINCRAVLESLISGAKHSIFIQNQYIEDDSLAGLLGEKIHSLGTGNIHIQLPETDKNKIFQQKFSKTIVKLLKKPYIHAKMMLIDKRILYLGSINFSSNSMDNNREIGILLTDPRIIQQFLAVFEDTNF